MTDKGIAFEETFADSELDEAPAMAEVALSDRPILCVSGLMLLIGVAVAAQVLWLGIGKSDFYVNRSLANLGYRERIPAPRGIISDRAGVVLAENRAVFGAFLDVKEFLRKKEFQQPTLSAIKEILGIPEEAVWASVNENDIERFPDPIVLTADLAHAELVALKEKNLPTLVVSDSFTREYPKGTSFASVLGYVGLASPADFQKNPDLGGQEMVGKSGIEAQYDSRLRGASGAHVTLRDAKGNVLGEIEKSVPKIGEPLTLTIDGEFQEYVYERFMRGLSSLGRTNGAALAIDPRSGEVLALISFPSFDNNLFVASGKSKERQALLSSPLRPLFNRVVQGAYAPGSTIKPLVGVAALKEGVITPERTIFSPGYLDVPNRYDPEHPTRFPDWRYQGDVDLSSALAQSSNVYFYTVGGGAGDVKGLGIERLGEWWKKFKLGEKTGIDLPGEAQGFLPSIEWKDKVGTRPWLLGDTYNVSIGQGDLLVTPLQLLDYIAAIANDGKMYAPHILKQDILELRADLSDLLPEIREVQKGMLATVTASLGTAHTMADLGLPVAGKTGSAQVKNNQEENAFFVGDLPTDLSAVAQGAKEGVPSETGAPLALLILIENSKEGSLNAVPIAKDVMRWYYEHRIANSQ